MWKQLQCRIDEWMAKEAVANVHSGILCWHELKKTWTYAGHINLAEIEGYYAEWKVPESKLPDNLTYLR